ncbi:MAG: hypothetical protein Ct9H300mP16_04880 [Pseudomonadota bacterium]|nr:MAG: hypothetical protein Ct9H300mP16_04880 [Pseudomonadota bacterium]
MAGHYSLAFLTGAAFNICNILIVGFLTARVLAQAEDASRSQHLSLAPTKRFSLSYPGSGVRIPR